MRIILFSLMMAASQFSFAMQGGEKGCHRSNPLEAFELAFPDQYSYGQTCAAMALINNLIMQRHVNAMRNCFEQSIRGHEPKGIVNLPLTLSISEQKIEVLAPDASEMPMDLLATELRECVVKYIERIPSAAPQIRDIGGRLPWIMKGSLPFGISNR